MGYKSRSKFEMQILADCFIIAGPVMFVIGLLRFFQKKPEALDLIVCAGVIVAFGLMLNFITKRIDGTKTTAKRIAKKSNLETPDECDPRI